MKARFQSLAARLLLALVLTLPAAGDAPPIASADGVHKLPEAEASRELPVSLRGVVTRVTPFELYVQDESGGVFVWQEKSSPTPKIGDLVEIEGVTNPGHLFSIVKQTSLRIVGHAGFPVAKPVRFTDLASGREDCVFVEAVGQVCVAERAPDNRVNLRIAFDGAVLYAAVHPVLESTDSWLGALVRVRGVAGGSKVMRRKIVEPILWVANTPDTFKIVSPGPGSLFDLPRYEVAQTTETYSRIRGDHLVKLGGVVTSCNDRLLFVRDGDHSLEIHLLDNENFQAGDVVEVVGLIQDGVVQPFLEFGRARKTGTVEAPMPKTIEKPRDWSLEEEGDLIRIEGVVKALTKGDEGLFMTLAAGDFVFGAQLRGSGNEKELRMGAKVSVTGICHIERLNPPDRFQLVTPASATLALRGPSDLVLLDEAPWWTIPRLLSAGGGLLVLLLAALGWAWSLDRRVRAQTHVIEQTVKREVKMQERNRIAREFHDTVEQELAGATIMLDAMSKSHASRPELLTGQLDTVRAMLRKTLEEAQHAVMDLRADELFETALPELMVQRARQKLLDQSIECDFQEPCDWPVLTPVAKKQLVRILEESLTNIVKHARATKVVIRAVVAGDQWTLSIADNGEGDDHLQEKIGKEGRFGLLGMQERAQKIGGELHFSRAAEGGLCVKLLLPIKAEHSPIT